MIFPLATVRWRGEIVMNNKYTNSLVLFLTFFVATEAICKKSKTNNLSNSICIKPKRKLGFDHLWDLIKDAFIINKNLFHADSFKILATAFPVIGAGFMVDNAIHKNFYCYDHHKNINQMHCKCHKFAESWAVPLIATTASACFVFSHNENLRQTSRAFILGLPFVILVSDILKWIIKVDTCYRPFNERFYRNRSVTGFPSTHAAQMTYAAVLFGMRLGPAWGIPLGILDAFVAFSCLNDNRHFLSQYLGGMTLGALYAFAADKLVHDKLKHLDVCFTLEAPRTPTFKVGFKF
jgi:membrane-associated phospholipid phosphatase